MGKSGSNKEKPYYGKLFYFCRGLLRLCHKKITVLGEKPLQPAVFIGHHQNLMGAVRAMMWLNFPLRVWILSVFCQREECFQQYSDYTFTQRFGWPKVLARAAAGVLARFVPALAKSLRAIPVYRTSARDLQVTLQESVATLCNKENILIFPDIDYTNRSDRMGPMYKGFIHIDKYYHAQTGQHVDFVPLRIDLQKRELRIGAPSRIRAGENFIQGKDRVYLELQKKMNF